MSSLEDILSHLAVWTEDLALTRAWQWQFGLIKEEATQAGRRQQDSPRTSGGTVTVGRDGGVPGPLGLCAHWFPPQPCDAQD